MSYVNHRRITAFWLVALLSLTIPWSLKGCQMVPATTGKIYEDCAVLSIYDGDTMTVNCAGEKVKVRLYCVDAPEMGQVPWGRGSRDHLRSLTGNTVRLVAYDHDRYGRTVGELYSGGVNLNLAQVGDGWAAAYRRFCPVANYHAAERKAKSAGAGIWVRPGEQQTPWLWRHSH